MTQRLGVVLPVLVLVNAALFLSARFLSLWMGLGIAAALVLVLWPTVRMWGWRVGVSRNELGLAQGAFGLLLAIAAGARIADSGFDAAYASAVGLTETARLFAYLGIVVVVVAKEELFLRVLQSYLFRWPAWFGAVLVSLNFALLHTPFYAPQHAAVVWGAIAASSFVLALLFATTRNIMLTFFVHVLIDAVLLVQIVLHVGNPRGEAWFWACAAVVMLAAVPGTRRLLKTVRFERIAGSTITIGVLISLGVGLVLLIRQN